MASKLNILPEMLSTSIPNLSPYSLFDGDPNTFWFPGWNASLYPAKVWIDLKGVHKIEKLRIFDGSGQPIIRFYFSKNAPDDTTGGTVSQKLDAWQVWRDVPINAEARYVAVELQSSDGSSPIGELEIYGAPLSNDDGGGGVTPPTAITGDAAKINVCGFHWVPLDVYEPFSMVREYTMWRWFENKKGLNAFEPTALGNGNYDTHYAALKAKGIAPVFVINTLPDWFNDYPAGVPWDMDHKPKAYLADAQDAMSYKAIARFAFQLAARYGKVKHDPSVLTLDTTPRWENDPINEKKSGLNLLNYIEVWNEPDKWWKGDLGAFNPEDYAALLSACYDGHEGKLGAGHGIKTADPSMNVVMAGLATLNTDYVDRMNDWFKTHRSDKRFAAEVLNFHHYSNRNDINSKTGFDIGVSPEADKLGEKLAVVNVWRKKNYPNQQLWLSEYGYDTSDASPQRPDTYGKLTLDELQGMWLVRSSLEIIASGFDRAFIFNAIDEPGENGLFAASGLTHSEAAGFTKKASWYKIKDFIQKINGKTLPTTFLGAANIKNYWFQKDKSSVAFMWSPTSDGTTMKFGHPTQGTFMVTETAEGFEVVK
jgi:hypothetical protein